MTFLSPTASFLCPEGYAGPRGTRPLLDERRTLIEARTLLCHPVWRGRGVPRGDGLPVLLIPGFMAGDVSLRFLSRWLGRMGYLTYRSKVHLNIDCTRATVDRLERRLELMAERERRPVAVVGQSLGGLLAKGIAIRRPDLVSGIVSLGSPHVAPSAAHRVLLADLALLTALNRAGLRHVLGADCVRGHCASEAWRELQQPYPAGVPFTSIYSRSDGIVDWRACLDPAAEKVEVQSSHIGMAVHPAVYRVVGERLGAIARRTADSPPQPPRVHSSGAAAGS